MTIETKYNVGDEVWHKKYPKPESSTVTDITISIHGQKQYIEYELSNSSSKFYETELFSTREQLQEHLRDEALAKVDALFVEEVAE